MRRTAGKTEIVRLDGQTAPPELCNWASARPCWKKACYQKQWIGQRQSLFGRVRGPLRCRLITSGFWEPNNPEVFRGGLTCAGKRYAGPGPRLQNSSTHLTPPSFFLLSFSQSPKHTLFLQDVLRKALRRRCMFFVHFFFIICICFFIVT